MEKNIFRIVWINKTSWLTKKNLFIQVTIQEGIMGIELTNNPIKIDSQWENNAYGRGFNNWTKCLKVDNFIILAETLSN